MNDYPILRNIMDLARPETWQLSLDLGDETIARWLAATDVERIRRVYFIGAGTSCYAGEVAKRIWERLVGIPCEAWYAFDLAAYGEPELLNSEALVVGISTTGGTGTVVDALRLAERGGAQTLAVTAYPNASVAQAAQGVVLTGGDTDLTPVKSKSYNQSLVSLYLLALALGKARGRVTDADEAYWRDQIAQAALGVRRFLETQLGEIDALVQTYVSTQMVFMLASGPNLGTIHEGALKVIEMAKMYSEPTELEDFLHGRYREVDQVTPMFFLAPEGRSSAHLLDVLTTNVYVKAPSVVFTDQITPPLREMASQILQLPSLDELATPLLYATPLHYFAHQMAIARGWDPLSRRYDDIVPARVKYGNLEAGLIR
jgi:glucosamine 6-phosphate synthetase-like amidotransferase/phosphosugar isomerase protein